LTTSAILRGITITKENIRVEAVDPSKAAIECDIKLHFQKSMNWQLRIRHNYDRGVQIGYI